MPLQFYHTFIFFIFIIFLIVWNYKKSAPSREDGQERGREREREERGEVNFGCLGFENMDDFPWRVGHISTSYGDPPPN